MKKQGAQSFFTGSKTDPGFHIKNSGYRLTGQVSAGGRNFENSAIEAIKSDKVTFIHVKSVIVTFGFNLRKLKKIRQMELAYQGDNPLWSQAFAIREVLFGFK